MIAVTGISKRFGALDALSDVALSLRPGAVTALVGPNGSGKTTLIKIMLGLARADRGELRVGGVLADANGEYRRTLGYMPQAAQFPQNLRVRDVFELIASLRPTESRDDELICAFGLEAEMNKRVGTLSGGTRQKVSAALAFLFNPGVLILDEPTAGLDPVASGTLKDKIRRARDAGRTILVSSHIIAELEELSDDVAFLCDGRLHFAGPVAELLYQMKKPRLEPAIAAMMRARRVIRSSDPVPAAEEA